jgi:uroporphyrinogen decarboxylase
MSRFIRFVADHSGRLAMPILTFPGAALAGATVRQMVTDPAAQVAAQLALRERFATPVLLSCMDLSVEAEAFGCTVPLADDEVPTVVGRLVTNAVEAAALRVPAIGAGRTGVYLEAVRRLAALPGRPLVLAGMIGPFSLAGRLFGVSETLGLSLEDPELTHVLLGKVARFLTAYAQAFKAAGAAGVIMAEPTAGLLSPRAMATFSSAYVNQIVTAVDDDQFTLILHNCAAKPVHLPALLGAGAKAVHVGAPMDLPTALAQTPADLIVCGNLDPAAVFVQSSPGEVRAAVHRLLGATQAHRNFVLSSGCDVPPKTPMPNLEAFFAALAEG